MTLSLSKLMAVADKATDGPWSSDEGRGIWCPNAKIGGITKIFDIRGWGYFTGLGHGALGMSEDAAIKQQEANGEYVATFDPPTVKRLLAIARAAAVFLDDCPIGDDDKPYVTDICNGKEFRALRAALEVVEL